MASLSIEICAFTVAIALVMKPYRPEAPKYQWSAVELACELRNIDPNLRVDVLPLHQGLNIFKKPIESLSNTIVSMNSKDIDRTEACMDRNAIRRGSDIIFISTGLVIERTRQELILEILKMANFLLTKSFKVISNYSSISEIFGVLWLTHVDATDSESNKRRKLGAEIGERQMKHYGKQVYDYVSERTCAENESPSRYVEAGANYSQSKSTGDAQRFRSNLFEEEDERDLQSILQHPSVIESIGKFPKKNISCEMIMF